MIISEFIRAVSDINVYSYYFKSSLYMALILDWSSTKSEQHVCPARGGGVGGLWTWSPRVSLF